MFGKGAYVTDSDWHGIYDRTEVVGKPKEVFLGNNVWVGDSAIICKHADEPGGRARYGAQRAARQSAAARRG